LWEIQLCQRVAPAKRKRFNISTHRGIATPAPGTFGTVARNSVVSPGVLTNDISLNKSFSLFGDKGKLGIRADLFNLAQLD